MQLRLNYVHLVNFRRHEDYMFTPAPEGITAILGENGHGKSSIIDGIAWALYGVKPSKALKNSDLKRNNAAETDPCYVEVSLTLNDTDELIVNRSIKGKSATVQCECKLNGKLEAGPAVSNTVKWIPRQLGLDADGFLSAVLVQQKQVDDIISQSSSVRQSNIEKLTGITAATKALKTARDDANMIKKALSLIAPDAGDKEKYEQTIINLNKDIKKLSKKRQDLKTKLQNTIQSYNEMKAQYDNAVNVRNNANMMQAELNGCKESYELLCQQRDNALESLSALKANLPETTDTTVYDKQLHDAESKLHAMQADRAHYETIVSNAPTNGELKDMKAEIKKVKSNKPDYNMQALQSEADKLNESISIARASKKQALESLSTLQTGNDSMLTCPTCLQPIDDPEHVIKELNDIITKADADVNADSEALSIVNANMQALIDYDNNLKQLEDDLVDAKNRSDDGVKALKAIDELKPEMDSIELSVKILNSKIAGINADKLRIKQYDDAKKSFTESSDKATAMSNRIQDLKNSIASVDVMPERSLNALSTKVSDASDLISQLRMKAIEFKGNNDLLVERLDNAKAGLERATSEQEARMKALQQQEVAQASVSVLSGFREHLAQDAVPRITDTASDLMNEITDGAFVSIDMDEKYNITVTTGDGRIMDVHALSGGEQSAVAISLRLAISEMLSGGEPSMLILDEVLTAMDDTRAQSILTTIQDAGHGQVIIIAHNDIIRSIADTVVML